MSGQLRDRIVTYAVAAWGALTLNFFLPRMMPGDPVQATLGRLKGRLTPELESAIRRALGEGDGNRIRAVSKLYNRHLYR